LGDPNWHEEQNEGVSLSDNWHHWHRQTICEIGSYVYIPVSAWESFFLFPFETLCMAWQNLIFKRLELFVCG